jgi:hypothetical protein
MRWTAEEKQQIKDLWMSGLKIREIAEKLGHKKTRVGDLIYGAGWTRGAGIIYRKTKAPFMVYEVSLEHWSVSEVGLFNNRLDAQQCANKVHDLGNADICRLVFLHGYFKSGIFGRPVSKEIVDLAQMAVESHLARTRSEPIPPEQIGILVTDE